MGLALALAAGLGFKPAAMLTGGGEHFHGRKVFALESEVVATHRKLLIPADVKVLAIVTFWSLLLSHALIIGQGA